MWGEDLLKGFVPYMNRYDKWINRYDNKYE